MKTLNDVNKSVGDSVWNSVRDFVRVSVMDSALNKTKELSK